MGGTINAEGSWYEWKRERKPDERQHSSLLADGDCTVTNCPTHLPPVSTRGNASKLGAIISAAFVKYFILLIRKVGTEENTKTLELEAAGSAACWLCELEQRTEVSRT